MLNTSIVENADIAQEVVINSVVDVDSRYPNIFFSRLDLEFCIVS